MEPLVFAILAGLTPKDVKIQFYDERVEEIDFTWPADLVAMSVQTFTAKRAYHLASLYRKKGIPVILGGIHPSLLPEEAAERADCVVIGDAESVWSQIIEDFKSGKLQKYYQGDMAYSLSGIYPDRSVFRGKKYSFLTPVQFGRGCKFACDFCSMRTYYGNILRQRPVEEVIEEIKKIPSRMLIFVDDNLFQNFDKTVLFLKALIPLHVRWVCQISIDAAFNEELLSLMSESGCFAVFVGFESFNKSNLRQMKKSGNLQNENYLEAVRHFQKHGLMVCGSFIFGYDEDTEKTVEENLAFSLKARLCLAHFNPLIPTPKTPLYERLEAEGRLTFKQWWTDPFYNYGDGLFKPVRMTAEEVALACYRAKSKFNSLMNIFLRIFDFKANARNFFNLKAFLAANIISRIEIHKKQWQFLGRDKYEKNPEKAEFR